MSVPKRLIQKMKIKFLSKKSIVIFLFLLLITSVFGNETARLHQFNKNIRQAREEKESENYRGASEAFQKAKNVLGATFFLKSLKKEELEEIVSEIEKIRKLAEEKVKGTTTNDSPMAAPSPTTNPAATSENENMADATEQLKVNEKAETIIEQAQQELKDEEIYLCPTLSDNYATIINLEDSKGNVQRQSAHNNCPPFHGEFIVKNGDTITVSVSVDNKKYAPVLYEFIGSGFPNMWQSSNSATVTIDDKYERVHLRVFVKNSDDKFRAPDYDDMIQVFYKVVN